MRKDEQIITSYIPPNFSLSENYGATINQIRQSEETANYTQAKIKLVIVVLFYGLFHIR